ncbi:hypothetical protein FRE64_15445 [Euhalothece natronophila Z-M001]|uniref:Uncharacterized protein n=1 Tax=Euhalothece natronophila Z-M001 TaxID=522448 RepID=A0A5B8NT95_9CHRO|nr:hypothetical protein [Euhalothece natronophila]QDZ41555.1 hypothetical protein FRE64_15445 [Euhalothece natronophila Z-M001]
MLSLISFFHRIQSWFSHAEATATEETLEDLPPEILIKLEKIIRKLPAPPTYSATIQEAILSSLKNWEADKFANRLVILASPISELSTLIPRCVPDNQLKNVAVVYPFSDLDLRNKPLQITQKLKLAIDKAVSSSHQQKIIIVIPNLEQFFLRCIGGWDGIIWLREYIVNTPEHFWLLGCNDWSWHFLDYACQINAYLETIVKLPLLEESELETWLNPVHESITKEIQEKLPLFWQTLASSSEGKSEIATQIWLNSIKLVISEEQESAQLKLMTPSLPKLPALSASNRYILQAILLHGAITRYSLALSLGEKEDNIQAEIQILLKEDLIQQKAEQLMINPIHYPKIKQELKQNNFLIGYELS